MEKYSAVKYGTYCRLSTTINNIMMDKDNNILLCPINKNIVIIDNRHLKVSYKSIR